MEIVIGFGGVFLGFILSEIATWLRQRRNEKQQSQATRALLSLEIEQNLEIVRLYWEQIQKEAESAGDRRVVASRTANKIVDLPLPNWSHKAWESQMSVLTQVINSDSLLKKLYNHHAHLDAIVAIREKMAVLRQTQADSWQARQDSMGAVKSVAGLNQVFYDNTPALCNAYEKAVSEVLNIGNPLNQNNVKQRE